jgi:hypothetical protein
MKAIPKMVFPGYEAATQEHGKGDPPVNRVEGFWLLRCNVGVDRLLGLEGHC